MKKSPIFFSDESELESESEFKIRLTKKEENTIQMDQEKYLNQIIDQSRHRQNRKVKVVPKKAQESVKNGRKIDSVETSIESSHENIVKGSKQKGDDDIQFLMSDQIPVFKNREREYKIKKQRKNDQNLCKKYHTLANKCLKKLNIYKHVLPYARKIHKKNYFILVLIISRKCQKMIEFMSMYWKMAEIMIDDCQQQTKHLFNGSKEKKRSIQMVKQIYNSLEAMAYFEKGKLFKAVQSLFEVETLRRLTFVDDAFKQVLEYEYQITSKGSQI